MKVARKWAGAILWVVGSALVPGFLSGCAISMPSASPEVSEIQVRLVHVAPNTPRIDLEVGGVRAAQHVAYGTVSEYVRMPAGEYDILLFSTPEKMVLRTASSVAAAVALANRRFSRRLNEPNQPLHADSRGGTESFVAAKTVANLRGGGVFSVVATDEPNRMTALVLEDNVNPLFDQALVRFVHAVPDAPALQLRGEQDQVLLPRLAFGEVSTSQAMRPGFTQIQVALAPSTTSGVQSTASPSALERFDLQLEAGKVYTLYVAGLLRSKPGLDLVLAEETPAPRR
ncbi:MAG: DUF4397 domain-containing protein [Cyanobacteriota bacterium]